MSIGPDTVPPFNSRTEVMGRYREDVRARKVHHRETGIRRQFERRLGQAFLLIALFRYTGILSSP